MNQDDFCKKAAAVSSLKDLYALFDALNIPRPAMVARFCFTLFARKRLLFPYFLTMRDRCVNYSEAGKKAFNKLMERFFEREERAKLYLAIEPEKIAPKIEREVTAQERAEKILGERLTPFLHELYRPEFAGYPDIRSSGEALLHFNELSEEEAERRVQALQALLQKGRERNRKLLEIEQFYKKMQASLKSPTSYRDLVSKMQEIQKQCDAILLSKREYSALPMEKVDELFQERYSKMKALEAETARLFASFHADIHSIEEKISFQLGAIQHRLFELFTAHTPFPDLQEDLQSVQKALFSKIERLLHEQVSIKDFQAATYDLVYDHDVVQLRGELAFRATRLRELRVESHKIQRKLSRLVPLFHVAALSHEPIAKTLRAVEAFIRKLENPYELFRGVKAQFEDVNRVIRTLWIELEAFQKEAPAILLEAEHRLFAALPTLESRLFLLVDDMEEVLKEAQGKRPDLLLPIKRKLQEKHSFQQFIATLDELESKFPFFKPLTFIMQEPSSQLRKELLIKSRKLHEKLAKTHAFAKSLQFVKVYDEERIDVVLEAFEHVGFFEYGRSFGEYEEKLVHAAILVEEEVLLDMGGLDMRALLDINEEHLRSVLRGALKKVLPESSDSLFLLNEIERECAALFQKRVEEAARLHNPYALHLQIQKKVQDYVEACQAHGLFFDALKLLLMKPERALLEPAINKIFSKIESKDEAAQREVYTLLEQLDKASATAPLQYLPGCLNYFYK